MGEETDISTELATDIYVERLHAGRAAPGRYGTYGKRRTQSVRAPRDCGRSRRRTRFPVPTSLATDRRRRDRAGAALGRHRMLRSRHLAASLALARCAAPTHSALVLGVLAVSLVIRGAPGEAAAVPPNIVVITGEDMTASLIEQMPSIESLI